MAENKLAQGAYNRIIEDAVRRNTGAAFTIASVTPNTVSCMHDSVVFASTAAGDGARKVFVKLGTNPFSHDQFTQEAWGLEHIRTHSGVAAPRVIAVEELREAPGSGHALLIMEAIDVKPVDTKEAWEALGRGLALLHRTTAPRCGLETHSYLGIFRQDNTQTDTWEEFFAEYRLRDSMNMAVQSGNLDDDARAAVERLIERVPVLLRGMPADEPFSLLHGDPWPGNLLYDGRGLVAVDCSIYYGNREIDISTVDFFFPVPEHFFAAYNEAYPIDAGYAERKDLWQINQWLGHVTLFGAKYMPKLMAAVNRYI